MIDLVAGLTLLAAVTLGVLMTKLVELKVGDCVRERDEARIGVVVHTMKSGLVVVNFPPGQQGFAYHPDDLVKL